ncbi:MAG: hypothetical protein RLZZ381_2732 [Cyanobacteriota bacterium]|jgi:hypothetical protein
MKVTFLNDFTYTSKTAVDFTIDDIQLKQYEELSTNNSTYQTTLNQPDFSAYQAANPNPISTAVGEAFDIASYTPAANSSTRYGVNASANSAWASPNFYNVLHWDFQTYDYPQGGRWMPAGFHKFASAGGSEFSGIPFANSSWTLTDPLRFPQTDFNFFNNTKMPSNRQPGWGHFYPPSGSSVLRYQVDNDELLESAQISNPNSDSRRTSIAVERLENGNSDLRDALQCWGYDNQPSIRYRVGASNTIQTISGFTNNSTLIGCNGLRDQARYFVWVRDNLRFVDGSGNQTAFTPCLAGYYVRSMAYEATRSRIVFIATPSPGNQFTNAPGGSWEVWVGDINVNAQTLSGMTLAGTIRSSLGLNVGGNIIPGTQYMFMSGCTVDKVVDIENKTLVSTLSVLQTPDRPLFERDYLLSFASRNFEKDPILTLTIRTTEPFDYNNWVGSSYRIARVKRI